uniref:NADH-ubiquinone oxidoreductase chain 3 n=1 Tax=Oryctes rhinoceros TaxID=72550 RepID=A0A7D5BK79_ORYRH|nr:NADH dehydrogenase subunit 3 [Oryctes rhinoceros]WAT94204.1 NADH dehydrogenase subunit 3 [Oryctes rhinoceros]WDA95532.1 NADH dehydrogenase subunit 3 [Oryctes rhinoceros]WDA95545.1 NADH dehydrogenase subunit 3 [Oryctes rhinoceros]
MMILFLWSTIILFISFAMIMISFIISKKTFMDREKASPFECGFDPKSSSRMPFSIQFFLIAVIFLIFDVEIALLIPIILIMQSTNMVTYFAVTLFFLIILLAGLYHEWNQGALNWAV